MTVYNDKAPEAKKGREQAMRLVAAGTHDRESSVYTDELGRVLTEVLVDAADPHAAVAALVDGLALVACSSVTSAAVSSGADALLVLRSIEHAIEQIYGTDV